MKNVLSSMQMLKSSDDCNKFSKSVSYEALVGGTTTTGTGYKQIRRLFLSSANKPLSAVGTLTSLLCNSAKVMENLLRHVITRRTSVRRGYLPEQGTHANEESLFASVTCFMRLPRRIQRMLLVMTIPALALIFTIVTTAESRAECYAKEHWSENCYDTWNPGVADNCGDGCTYSYNNGKLTVTATKHDAIVPKGMFSSYYYKEGVLPNIDNIEIVGEFDTIKQHAFVDNSATISGKNGVLYVNNVGHNAFGNENNTIIGTVVLSDKQTSLNNFLYKALLEGTLIIPPTITEFTALDVFGLNLGENAKIYCGVENCEELFRNVDCDGIEGPYYATNCKNHLKTLLSSGKLLAYPDGCTKMGANGCTKCKNENFKLNDGECDRLRYTPAEAAEVLKNDNTNEVTITFKM